MLSTLTEPVTAAQPIIGGKAPAAPPMTMFCGVAPLQPHGVDEDVEGDGEGEQRAGHDIDQHAQRQDRARPRARCRR